jgi:hypothetical protein
MVSRIRNRRELREQADAATAVQEVETVAPGKVRKRKLKSAAAPKVRKPRAKKAPPRICAHWCIYDGSMKQVGLLFDYNQRAQAEERLATIRASKKGGHWMQIVKLPMVEPALEPMPAAL